MAKFDPSQNQNPWADCQKIVVGDQVGEETRSAKFGADRWTGVLSKCAAVQEIQNR